MSEDAKLGVKGWALNQMGEYAQAEVYLLKARSRQGRHRYGLATNSMALMENAIGRGNSEQAWLYLQGALQAVDDTAYAWVALEILAVALKLFVSEKRYDTAVEVWSLVAHHPDSMGSTRALLTPHETMLRATLPAEEYAAAWERGQHRDLGSMVSELMER